jgi:glutathione synthase
VLFVVEDSERNIIDQKIIEAELYRRYRVHSMRCTLEEVQQNASISETKVLKVHGREIGFVYYRTGYQINQYPTE